MCNPIVSIASSRGTTKTGRPLRISVEIGTIKVGELRIGEVLAEGELRQHVPEASVRISFGLDPNVSVPNAVISIGLQTFRYERKRRRVEQHSAIEEQDEVSTGLGEPARTSCKTAGVALRNHRVRETQSCLMHRLDGPVSRTVVDQDGVERQSGSVLRGGL